MSDTISLIKRIAKLSIKNRKFNAYRQVARSQSKVLNKSAQVFLSKDISQLKKLLRNPSSSSVDITSLKGRISLVKQGLNRDKIRLRFMAKKFLKDERRIKRLNHRVQARKLNR